jgi:hypothetical protein
LTEHILHSGLLPDVLLRKLNKDISLALRRGTNAQVSTHALDGYAAQRAAENERGGSGSLDSLSCISPAAMKRPDHCCT